MEPPSTAEVVSQGHRDTDRDKKCDPHTQATQKQSDSRSVATYQSGEHSLLSTNSEDRAIAKGKDYDEK